MWQDKHDDFEIDVMEGWNLHIGPNHQFPVNSGHMLGRFSKQFGGVELTKNSKKNPFRQMRQFLGVNGTEGYELGYAPRGLLWTKSYSSRDHDDSDPKYKREVKDTEYIKAEEKEEDDMYSVFEQKVVLLPDKTDVKNSECTYLGRVPTLQEGRPELIEIVHKVLYSVNVNGSRIGYLFTVGLQLDGFHIK